MISSQERYAYKDPRVVNNQEENSIYARVACRIEPLLHFIDADPPSNTSTDTLKETIKNFGTSIDYDRYGQAFIKLYWLRNYWKALYCFKHEMNLENVKRVVVLGSGSGADTVALLAAVHQQYPERILHATLVDKSQKQLDLASQFIAHAESEFTNSALKVNFKKQEIKDWTPQQNSSDLVVLSHVLTENPQDIERILKKVHAAITDNGSICIIERERDPIWIQAREILQDMNMNVHDSKVKPDLLKKLLMPLGAESVEYADITPHYIIAQRATRS